MVISKKAVEDLLEDSGEDMYNTLKRLQEPWLSTENLEEHRLSH